MLPSRYFSELTQPEIAAQFQKNPLVILPCGSVEQHGPHLPTGTDTLAANIIGHAVAERMDGLVLPNTPLGVTPMHAPFEGTITLTPDTYMRLIIETCASTVRHGAKELMIVNWHEGNIPSLAIAAESVHPCRTTAALAVDLVARVRSYDRKESDMWNAGSRTWAVVARCDREPNTRW